MKKRLSNFLQSVANLNQSQQPALATAGNQPANHPTSSQSQPANIHLSVTATQPPAHPTRATPEGLTNYPPIDKWDEAVPLGNGLSGGLLWPLIVAGKTLGQVAQSLEVSEQTFHRWRNQYGGMKAEESKRLKELENENKRLKRLLAEQMLDASTLRELLAKNF